MYRPITPMSVSPHDFYRLGKVTAVVLAVSVLLTPLPARASSGCKPDVSTRDKITKQRSDEWALFGDALHTESYISIAPSVSRVGNENRLNVILSKRDVNPGPSLYATTHTEFFFGFANGDPVKFVSDRISEESRPDSEYVGRVVKIVILIVTIKDDDLPALRASLTSQSLDAFRVVLPNNLIIESSVKSRFAARFREKLLCFFRYAEEEGFMKAAAEPAAPGSPTPSTTGTTTPPTAGESSPDRVVPFRTGTPIPLAIVNRLVTIDSVEVIKWPTADAVRKSEGDSSRTTKLPLRFSYSNRGTKDREYQFRVAILDDKGEEIGTGDENVSLDSGEKPDTNTVSVAIRTLDFPRAAQIRVRAQER